MKPDTMNFLLQLCTSLGSAALVGWMFWTWITSKFNFMERTDAENRARIIELERKNAELLSKEDHYIIRKEDKDALERQISELRSDIKHMPERIVAMIERHNK